MSQSILTIKKQSYKGPHCIVLLCLVSFNPVTINASLFNHMPAGRALDSMIAPTKNYSFQLVGTDAFLSVAWTTGVQLVILFYFRFSVACLTSKGSPAVTQHVVSVESSFLIHHCIFRDLFVLPRLFFD